MGKDFSLLFVPNLDIEPPILLQLRRSKYRLFSTFLIFLINGIHIGGVEMAPLSRTNVFSCTADIVLRQSMNTQYPSDRLCLTPAYLSFPYPERTIKKK